MYKKILVFICCVVLVSKTITSQVVSVEGVWHADTVQYAAPFSLGFWFVNTGTTPILDSFITANIVIAPVNAAPQNWQTLTFIQNIPQGVFAPGDSLFIDDLNASSEWWRTIVSTSRRSYGYYLAQLCNSSYY